MPNHVTNRIVAPKEVIQKLMGTDKDGKPCVDFNNIIPMPDIIKGDSVAGHVESAAQIALGLIDFKKNNYTTGTQRVNMFNSGDYGGLSDILHHSNCVKQLLEGPHPKDFNDEDFNAFIRHLQAYRQCDGLMNWYKWSCKKWGTKWNAYEFEKVSETEITFQTAWSAPFPVMVELAKQTGKAFLHEWADEDTGSNVGFCRFPEGEDGEGEVKDLSGTKEGYELAFRLHPGAEENYRLVDGKYKYHEEEE